MTATDDVVIGGNVISLLLLIALVLFIIWLIKRLF